MPHDTSRNPLPSGIGDSAKLLNAWTPETYNGIYPEYVNVMQYGARVKISIRGPTKDDGSPGTFIEFYTNNWTLNKIGKALKEASDNYETIGGEEATNA